MIPYEVIMPSASRSKLFAPSLLSVLGRADQVPRRVIVHDDVVKPDDREAVQSAATSICQAAGVPLLFLQDEPPLSHGLSLYELLRRVETEYVLYSQDDAFVERDVPVQEALALMHQHKLHQIRFNKRPTMEYKLTFHKKEFQFLLPLDRNAPEERDGTRTLTVADHWYFQLGLWRVARILPVVHWWVRSTGRSFAEHSEVKINKAMNRDIGEFNHWALANGYELPEQQCYAMEPDVRARVHRTFIWGPIGEDRFFDNLAVDPKDWRLVRPRGGSGPVEVDSQAREQRG